MRDGAARGLHGSSCEWPATELQQSDGKIGRPVGAGQQGAGLVAGSSPDLPMSKFTLAALPRRAVIIAGVAIVALAAAAAFTVLHARHADGGAAADDASTAQSGSGDSGTTEVDILLGLARDATREGRMVAPQGNNPSEFHPSVIQVPPNNPQ